QKLESQDATKSRAELEAELAENRQAQGKLRQELEACWKQIQAQQQDLADLEAEPKPEPAPAEKKGALSAVRGFVGGKIRRLMKKAATEEPGHPEGTEQLASEIEVRSQQ